MLLVHGPAKFRILRTQFNSEKIPSKHTSFCQVHKSMWNSAKHLLKTGSNSPENNYISTGP